MVKKTKTITVGFIALGCPKNIVDSEKMLAQIAQAGMLITPDTDNADIVVINTCGFIAPAKAEAIAAIKDAVKQKNTGNVKKIIVAGCLSQRMGKQLINEVKGIDAILGLEQRDNIAQIIAQTLSAEKPVFHLTTPTDTIHDDTERLLINPPHWAYLRISEGCNRKCSFCTIPAIRGKFRSKPQDMVLAEAHELAANGAVELSIIAQDSNFYGKDLKIKNGLTNLLKKLEKIPSLRWIRLMYLYPAGIDDDLIQAIAESKKILHYIDMPIQHINDHLLKQMRRSDTKQHTIKLIEKLRSAMPEVVLRTTIIAGFPGETENQFTELLEFIKWARFDALGCFTFYPEQDTAATQLPNQIDENTKRSRAEAIMHQQQKIAFAKNQNRIGQKLTCLLDEIDKNSNGIARFFGQAPHIDSICLIKNCNAKPGDFLKTTVTAASGYDLILEQI